VATRVGEEVDVIVSRAETVDYDVVVVGAGPAGCAAAYDLRSAGRSVLLLDRTEFPRVKACAGGLTIKTLHALRYPVRPVIRKVCRSVILGQGLGQAMLLKSAGPICAMSVRAELDAFCLSRTRERGASFSVTRRITAVAEEKSRVTIDTDQGLLRSRFLVGADGANSTVRRLSGQFPEARRGLAIEADVPLSGIPCPKMEFDFGVVPSGYGWIFPRDDHINVGLYTNSRSVKLSRALLQEYARERLKITTLEHVIGHAIGLAGWHYRPASKRVFLAGDAAGLVDPLLGEGIYNAIRSGQMAAGAIDQELSGEGQAVEIYRRSLNTLQADVLACYRSAHWFYSFPRAGYAILMLPFVRYLLVRGFAKGIPFSKIQRVAPVLATSA
jgi:geranylgeranyl reductase family protein